MRAEEEGYRTVPANVSANIKADAPDFTYTHITVGEGITAALPESSPTEASLSAPPASHPVTESTMLLTM